MGACQALLSHASVSWLNQVLTTRYGIILITVNATNRRQKNNKCNSTLYLSHILHEA